MMPSTTQTTNDPRSQTLRQLLNWIDEVPHNLPLPAMPGFDRDHVESLFCPSEDSETTTTFNQAIEWAMEWIDALPSEVRKSLPPVPTIQQDIRLDTTNDKHRFWTISISLEDEDNVLTRTEKRHIVIVAASNKSEASMLADECIINSQYGAHSHDIESIREGIHVPKEFNRTFILHSKTPSAIALDAELSAHYAANWSQAPATTHGDTSYQRHLPLSENKDPALFLPAQQSIRCHGWYQEWELTHRDEVAKPTATGITIGGPQTLRSAIYLHEVLREGDELAKNLGITYTYPTVESSVAELN